ncbi:unnamed protein product [Camellia sinensis]
MCSVNRVTHCLPDKAHLHLNSFDLFPNTPPSPYLCKSANLNMLRNSVSFSSKLLTSSNPNSKSTFLFPGISTTYYGIERSLSHSQFYSTTATSPSSSPDSLKLGFPKLDPVRSSGFASFAAAIDASPLAAASVSRARDVVDLARHYGRCYWELSKGRLSMLVVATSGTGYVLGSGNAIDYVGLCCTCAGTMMVAASTNSLNQCQRCQLFGEVSGRVRVVVRLYPQNAEELAEFKRLKLQRNIWDSDTYEFDEVLTKFALQKHVYDVVAKPVIEESVLDGYNGTVMAYNQTGTGKIYTLGRLGEEDTADRGIM